MESSAAVKEVASVLRRRYGPCRQIGRSNVFTFGSGFTCSINYSKLLAGHKYFFGIPRSLMGLAPDGAQDGPGANVLLICGAPDNVLVLPMDLVASMLSGVPSRRVDVFVEGGMYILQTTRHPKLDVSGFLNAFPAASSDTVDSDAGAEPADAVPRVHVRIQHSLIRIGRAEGCAIWVPQNDRHLSHNGERFTSLTIDRLPRFGFDENSRRIIQNIDVLWLDGNVIHKAFEIEATTSIYSGLLRLNDLVLAQPNNRIGLFIAASQQKKQRVFEQLIRPSFRLLITKCGFVDFEEIDGAMQRLVALEPGEGTRVSGLLQGERFELPEHVVYPVDTR